MNLPTLQQCEAAIGIPAGEWSGRCYEIATLIHEAGLVPGRVVYGHWTGPVSPRSPLYRKDVPFSRHGWIVVDDDGGQVFDPTRWVFEARSPYVFVGEPPDYVAPPCEVCGLLREEHETIDDACDEFTSSKWPYDEGGNEWRAATQRPMPKSKGRPTIKLKLPRSLRSRLAIPATLTYVQACWLANVPFSYLGEDAGAVYEALITAGHSALIPIDNLRRAQNAVSS